MLQRAIYIYGVKDPAAAIGLSDKTPLGGPLRVPLAWCLECAPRTKAGGTDRMRTAICSENLLKAPFRALFGTPWSSGFLLRPQLRVELACQRVCVLRRDVSDVRLQLHFLKTAPERDKQ